MLKPTVEKTDVEVSLNSKLYNEMDEICEDLGMSVEDAFQIFARKMVNEQGIPFEVTEKEYPADEKKDQIWHIVELVAGIGLVVAVAAGIASVIRAIKDREHHFFF